MICPKCQSENVVSNTSVYTESKSRSFIWNLLMTLCTMGFWILWMLIRKRKEVTKATTTATCQNCGYSWNVKTKKC